MVLDPVGPARGETCVSGDAAGDSFGAARKTRLCRAGIPRPNWRGLSHSNIAAGENWEAIA